MQIELIADNKKGKVYQAKSGDLLMKAAVHPRSTEASVYKANRLVAFRNDQKRLSMDQLEQWTRETFDKYREFTFKDEE